MKKRTTFLALVLVMVLGTSVAFGWTHFYNFSKTLGPNETTETGEFYSSSNFVINYTQSVPNTIANSTQVRVIVMKGNTIVTSKTVTGDNVSEKITVSSGAGNYTITFRNLSSYTVNVSGSAMK